MQELGLRYGGLIGPITEPAVNILDWAGVGTGSDDTASVQAAINQAAGGQLQIPGGMVLHTKRLDLTAGDSTTQVWTSILGLGMFFLRLIDGTNDHHLVTGQWSRLILQNAYLDGDKANQSGTSHGLYWPAGTGATPFKELPGILENVIVRNYLTDNINVEQYRSHGFMTNVTSELAGRDAYINAAVDWQHANSGFGLCGRDAISIGNEWSGVGIKAYGSGLTDATGANVHCLSTAVNVRISTLQNDSGYRHGIKIENSAFAPYEPRALAFSNVVSSYNGRASAGSYSDIWVDGAGAQFDGLSFASAFSGPGGSAAITEKYNVEFGPNYVAGQVLDVGPIDNYLGAVTPPGSFIGLTNDFKLLKYATVDTLNEASPSNGRLVRHSSSSHTFLQTFVGSDTNARLQWVMDGTVAWGTGSAAVDAFVGRIGTTMAGAFNGTTWQAGQEGTWNGGHLTIGPYHLWVDGTGALRIKNGAPTGATDGVVVGTQV